MIVYLAHWKISAFLETSMTAWIVIRKASVFKLLNHIRIRINNKLLVGFDNWVDDVLLQLIYSFSSKFLLSQIMINHRILIFIIIHDIIFVFFLFLIFNLLFSLIVFSFIFCLRWTSNASWWLNGLSFKQLFLSLQLLNIFL